ncbi:MAG: hypothetical protein WBA51_07320 [Erythrobacter sp.]
MRKSEMSVRNVAAVMMALAVAACAGGGGVIPASKPRPGVGGGSASGAPVPQAPAPQAPGAFRNPQVMRGGGLDRIIGQQAAALTNRFGTARIDLTEGDARKLQFVSEACVLDIFLYPLASGAEPVATHVEARERKSGGAVDRQACMKAVEKAR